MNTLVTYSIEVSIVFIILFLSYKLLFNNNSHFKVRRFMLLGIILISFIVPQVELETTSSIRQQLPALPNISAVVLPAPVSQQMKVLPDETIETNFNFNSFSLLNNVYFVGLIISIALLSIELLKCISWVKKSKHSLVNYRKEIQSPFSYFNKVFVPDSLKAYEERGIIIAHEAFHVKQHHTLDLLISRIFLSFLWYNPVAYWYLRELKLVHEAMADAFVTKKYGEEKYLETLLSLKLSTFDFSLQNTFNSQLSKRLKLMNTPKSSPFKTTLLILLFAFIPIIVLGMQQKDEKDTSWSSYYQDRSDVDSLMINPSYALESLFKTGHARHLSTTLSKKLALLQKNQNDTRMNYLLLKRPYEFLVKSGKRPIYLTAIEDMDRDEIYQRYKSDTARISFDSEGLQRFSYADVLPNLRELIDENFRYFVVYANSNQRNRENSTVYSIWEVDEPAEVYGGIEALQNAIAIDSKIPSQLDRQAIPKTIDFEFVVRGGSSISNISLMTEIDRPEDEALPYYRFFGQVHNTMKDKISRYYPWKRALKDGNEVLMKVRLSIPTNLMED